MNFLIELFTVLVEIVLAIYFLSSFLDYRKPFRFSQYMIILGYGILLFLVSYYEPASIIHVLLTILATLFLVKLLFQKPWVDTFYPTFLYLVPAILVDVLCGAFLRTSGFSANDITGDGIARVIYNAMAKMLHLLTLYIILQCTNRKYDSAALRRSLPLLSCLFFSFVFCYLNFSSLMAGSPPIPVLLETLGLLYINILICAYVEILNRSAIKQKEAELARQQLEVRESYYHDLVARQEETRSLWHDIKKYMATMENLVSHENQEEAQRCLEDVRASFASIHNIVDTGNTIIDGILAYGIKKGNEADVKINTHVWLDSTLNIPASDLFVIIGNTLDNAIEACSVLPDKDKRIVSINLNQKNHLLSYEISNEYQPQKAKKKGQVHGYGLRNVETLVERNSGNMSIEKDNGRFVVSIRLNV